jgi:hypothetical protein
MASMAEATQLLNGWPLALTWRRFRAVNNAGRNADAQTSTNLSYNSSGVHIHNNEYKPRIRATLRLTSRTTVRQAWLNPATAAAKAELLEHEQGHYDIAGLLLRDFLYNVLNDASMDRAVVEILTSAGNTAGSRMAYMRNKAGNEIQAAWTRLQALQILVDAPDGPNGEHRGLYERDTNHSRNRAGQARWTRMLRYARTTNTTLAMTLFLFGVVPAHTAFL